MSLSYENTFDTLNNKKLSIDLFGIYNTSQGNARNNIFNYTSDWMNDTNAVNDYTYLENINSIYAQYAYSFKTGEFSVGLRAEMTLLKNIK